MAFIEQTVQCVPKTSTMKSSFRCFNPKETKNKKRREEEKNNFDKNTIPFPEIIMKRNTYVHLS